MSAARAAILARIGRSAPPPGTAAASPAVPPGDWPARAADFTARARAAAATVEVVAAADAVPAAIAAYLQGLGLPPEIQVTGSPPGLTPWPAGAALRRAGAPLRDDGETVVSGCLAAVAGEGVVALASGPGHASEAAFLAATLVVVVTPHQLLDTLECLWRSLRAAGEPPRMVNLVLGPSRTADLGVPSRLGAHGPLRVHVILLAG